MDRAELRSRLAVAQDHLLPARQRVARQKALLARLAKRSDPLAQLAARVLEALEESLVMALSHAHRLESAVAEGASSDRSLNGSA